MSKISFPDTVCTAATFSVTRQRLSLIRVHD